MAPRVLLADEVGLGTIEAGLIIHRQLLSGRAGRVLILVPENLQHQWLVEMRRRFQPAGGPVRQGALRRKRCQQSLRGQPVGPGRPGVAEGRRTRPGRPVRRRLGPAGGRRSPPPGLAPGPGQRRIRAGRATGGDHSRRPVAHRDPEQLGQDSHFARLRLLDPNRFHDLEAFRRESEQYRPVAEAVQELLDHGSLSAGARKAIHGFLGSGATSCWPASGRQ